jgi:hypothetical protein
MRWFLRNILTFIIEMLQSKRKMTKSSMLLDFSKRWFNNRIKTSRYFCRVHQFGLKKQQALKGLMNT